MLSTVKRIIRENLEFNAANHLCNLLKITSIEYGFEIVEQPRIEKRNPIGNVVEFIVCFALKKKNKAFPVRIKIHYYKKNYSFTIFAKNIGGYFCNGQHYSCRNVMNDRAWLEEMFYLFDIALRIEKYVSFRTYDASWGGSFLKTNGECIGIKLDGECVHRDDIVNIMGVKVWNATSTGITAFNTEEGFIDDNGFHSYKTNKVICFKKDKHVIETVTYNFACGAQDAKKYYESI